MSQIPTACRELLGAGRGTANSSCQELRSSTMEAFPELPAVSSPVAQHGAHTGALVLSGSEQGFSSRAHLQVLYDRVT